tara:strand:+ start:730 stop:942 length:213 start_codon:yes stop_codon:yes gene_type:complete
MNRDEVDSSMIKSLGYDAVESVLEVEFVRGGIYQYSDVPPDVYVNVMGADSVGKAFTLLVKSQGYEYRRV